MANDWRIDPSWELSLQKVSEDILERLGDDILADALRYAPVDTGRLRSSLIAEVSGGELRVGSIDCKYAVYQELGTRHMPPQPYLQPALYRPRSVS